jgi:hypothetical protein
MSYPLNHLTHLTHLITSAHAGKSMDTRVNNAHRFGFRIWV